MNMKGILLSAAFAATIVVSPAIAAGTNLLANGGFETGDFTGWTLSGNTGYTSVQSSFDGFAPYEGAYFALLGPVGSDGYLSQTFSDTAGAQYDVSFALGSDGGTPNDFGVTVGGFTYGPVYDIPPTGGYTLITGTFVGSGSDTITLSFRNDPGYLALDAVSVSTAVPEPSTWAMMGLGFAGLAFAGYRTRRTAISIA